MLRDFDQLSDKPSNFSKQVKPTDSILKKLLYFKGCVNTFVRVLIYFYNSWHEILFYLKSGIKHSYHVFYSFFLFFLLKLIRLTNKKVIIQLSSPILFISHKLFNSQLYYKFLTLIIWRIVTCYIQEMITYDDKNIFLHHVLWLSNFM